MSSHNIKYPDFHDAQKLYARYSTLQTSEKLRLLLENLIDSSYILANKTFNEREILNKIILSYYPNETTIKSSFINQVLFKTNDHVSIFEMPVGNSRADICKINGTSVSFEIKTDLDSLNRLDKQLCDYLEFFEEVYVVCSENRSAEIQERIPYNCGIYTYTKKGNAKFYFSKHRSAELSRSLNPEKQLDILRKQELKDYFGVCNLSARGEIKNKILELFTPENINLIFKFAIKNRYHKQWNFLRDNHTDILEIDYQWFFKNVINPELIYT